MLAGKIIDWARLELTATLRCSIAATDFTVMGGIASGGIESYDCPTNIDRVPGIWIDIVAKQDPIYPAGQSSVTVEIPEASAYSRTVTQTGFVDGQSAMVGINGLRVYQSTTDWFVKWLLIDIWINGVLVDTLPPDTLIGSRMAPSGIPLLGIPGKLYGGAGPNPVLAVGVPPAYTTAQDNHVSVGFGSSGGWRYKETDDGNWITPPVNLRILGVPGGSCSVGSTPASVGASTTYNGSVSGSAYQQLLTVDEGIYTCYCDPSDHSIGIPTISHVWQTTATRQSNGGDVYLWPNLAKGVRRFAPTDYAAWIDAGGFPQALAGASFACYDGTLEEPPPPTVVTETRYPRVAKKTARVTNLHHSIEDPFGWQTYAPYSIQGYGQLGRSTGVVVIQPGACPLGGGGGEEGGGGTTPPDVCYPTYSDIKISQSNSDFPTVVDGSGDNPDLIPYLYHSDQIARLMDYSSCPHWSYRYHFPPDREGALQPDDWPLYGAQAAPSQYWIPMRSQWFSTTDTHLAEAERTGTRTDLISAPLIFGDLSTWCADVFTNQTSYWGVSRFKAQNRRPVLNVALDSSTPGRWTFTGGAGALGGLGIDINPSATTVTASFLLSSCGSDPWSILDLIDQVSVNWHGSTILRARVQMVGVDGVAKTLLTSPGSFLWRQAQPETKYAGSWGQQFGVGFDGLDQGSDVLAGGISFAEMAAPETAYALELLPVGTAKYLRFVFELADTSAHVSLSYPSFTTRQDRPTVIPETGQFTAALWPTGPGVRFGQWTFWDPSGGGSWVGPTPNITLLGGGWSVLDWLGTRRIVFDKLAPDDGIDAEIDSLYDSTEGQARANVAKGTNAFVIVSGLGKLTGILVNSQAEVPPLCCLPGNDRDGEWQRIPGSVSQVAWSHASEPRYLIKGGSLAADLVKPSTGDVWTAAGGFSVPGWSIHRHSHAVDNTENPYQIQMAGIEFATAKPWHGYFCSLMLKVLGIGYDVNGPLRHGVSLVAAENGHIVLGAAGNVLPQSWIYIDTGLVGAWARARWQDHNNPQIVSLFYGNGSSHCWFAQSQDEGRSWGTPVDMAAGIIGDFDESANGMRWLYKILSSDGGTTFDVWVKVLDSQLGVVFDWTKTNLLAVDNTTLACRESPDSNGAWRMGVWYSDGGSPAVSYAKDGIHFS